MNKLGFSYREVGHITLTLFNKLYHHYKNTFDFELMLEKTGTTYQGAYNKAQEDLERL